MASYKMTIFFNDGKNPLSRTVDYSNTYELKKDVVSIGVNGYLQTINDKNTEEYYIYHPSFKIEKIEIISI